MLTTKNIKQNPCIFLLVTINKDKKIKLKKIYASTLKQQSKLL